MILEWNQLFGQEDDSVFLRACAKAAKQENYFPSVKKISDALISIKKQDEWEALQARYRLERDKEMASLTEERISLLQEIDSMFGGEPIDWYREKSEAQQRLLGAMI